MRGIIKNDYLGIRIEADKKNQWRDFAKHHGMTVTELIVSSVDDVTSKYNKAHGKKL